MYIADRSLLSDHNPVIIALFSSRHKLHILILLSCSKFQWNHLPCGFKHMNCSLIYRSHGLNYWNKNSITLELMATELLVQRLDGQEMVTQRLTSPRH